jgi:signal transduction histidine kinase
MGLLALDEHCMLLYVSRPILISSAGVWPPLRQPQLWWKQCIRTTSAGPSGSRSSPTAAFFDQDADLRPDGTMRWMHCRISPVNTEHAHPRYAGIVEDVTERKKMENGLRRVKDAALKANKAKSEFLANMSHEIRTPLSGIIGIAEILSKQTMTANGRELVAQLQTAGRSLLEIINDILDISRIEAGRLSLTENFSVAHF